MPFQLLLALFFVGREGVACVGRTTGWSGVSLGVFGVAANHWVILGVANSCDLLGLLLHVVLAVHSAVDHQTT